MAIPSPNLLPDGKVSSLLLRLPFLLLLSVETAETHVVEGVAEAVVVERRLRGGKRKRKPFNSGNFRGTFQEVGISVGGLGNLLRQSSQL